MSFIGATEALPSTPEDLADNRRGRLSDRQRATLSGFASHGLFWLDMPRFSAIGDDLSAGRVIPVDGDIVWHPAYIRGYAQARFRLEAGDGRSWPLFGAVHLGRYRGYALPATGIVIGAEPIAVRGNETESFLLALAGCSGEAFAENRTGRLHPSQYPMFRRARPESGVMIGGFAFAAIGVAILALGVMAAFGMIGPDTQPFALGGIGTALLAAGIATALFAFRKRERVEHEARVESTVGVLTRGVSMSEVYSGQGDHNDPTSYRSVYSTWIKIDGRGFSFLHLDPTGLFGALIPGERYRAWFTMPSGIVVAVVPDSG